MVKARLGLLLKHPINTRPVRPDPRLLVVRIGLKVVPVAAHHLAVVRVAVLPVVLNALVVCLPDLRLPAVPPVRVDPVAPAVRKGPVALALPSRPRRRLVRARKNN